MQGETYLWFLAVNAGFMDLVTTYYGLQHGYIELNPFGVTLIETYGFSVLIILKILVIGYGLGVNEVMPMDKRFIVPGIIAVIWTGAFMVNVGILVSGSI